MPPWPEGKQQVDLSFMTSIYHRLPVCHRPTPTNPPNHPPNHLPTFCTSGSRTRLRRGRYPSAQSATSATSSSTARSATRLWTSQPLTRMRVAGTSTALYASSVSGRSSMTRTSCMRTILAASRATMSVSPCDATGANWSLIRSTWSTLTERSGTTIACAARCDYLRN